jgi:hypothetical protein
MPYHHWGDEDFDWKGLGEAIDFMSDYLRVRRVPVRQSKEKFGTVRIYTNLGWRTPHEFFYPGHCYCRYPRNRFGKWLWKMDIYYGPYVMRILSGWWVIRWHRKVYRDAHKKAIERWPHLRAEILGSPVWP